MSSVRLTKSMKEDIVTGILRDTPMGNFRDKAEKALTTYIVSTLPEFVRSMRDNKSMNKFLTGASVYLPLHPGRSSQTVSVSILGLYSNHGITLNSLPPALVQELQNLMTLHEEEVFKRDKLKSQLNAILYRYTTSAKLLKDYPDFEKYIPFPDHPPMPIAVNTRVLDELENLGWNQNSQRGNR